MRAGSGAGFPWASAGVTAHASAAIESADEPRERRTPLGYPGRTDGVK
jgi:hypothetical protein